MKLTYHSLLSCFFLLILLHTQSCSGQPQPAQKIVGNTTDEIDTLLQTYLAYGQFNGAVLVAHKGEVIYKKGLGFANMEWEIPNHANTKFRLASITKQFTSMLIMQLVADGQIVLDSSVCHYLPYYPKRSGRSVTIHHLLTHTSGIPSYTSFSNYRSIMGKRHSPGDLVNSFKDSALLFTPGSRHEYSNSGYVLLGVIIEELSGKTYEEMLQEKIFDPLQMTNSGFDHGDEILKNRASGYHRMGSRFVNTNYIDMSTPFSAGSIYSTVEDLFLWDQALYTEKLLPKKYIDMLFEEHSLIGWQHYGYGWEVAKLPLGNSHEEIETVGHSGFINGFNTKITRVPSENTVIILLNNTGGVPLFNITRSILGILHDHPYDPPKKSLAYSLLQQLETNGLEEAMKFYRETRLSTQYIILEDEMNMVGYELLQGNKLDEAAAVFKINMEAFPASFNVYDSYAEALMMLGNKAEAIEFYKKSLELNADNKNGIIMLKKLRE